MSNKYTPPKSYVQNDYFNGKKKLSNVDALDAMLETETQNNKKQVWSKIDKTQRLQSLHKFAEKYIRDEELPIKEEKILKAFFTSQLELGKFSKTKDVVYNAETREIVSIPGLGFTSDITIVFFIKNTDAKHVSVLKSLTPKLIGNSMEQTKNM